MAQLTMASETATAVIDMEAGCRLASLQVYGHELLVTEGPGPIHWGSYPMAPWAGRLRRGRFEYEGVAHAMPANLGAHALHGTVFTQPWEPEDQGVFVTRLTPPWPFPGLVRQRVELHQDRISLTLEVHSDEPMPTACGWHPWFRRRLGGVEGSIEFDAGYMELRDDAGIPGGRRVIPPPGPWDDCFGDLSGPPVIRWPGILSLEIDSSCDYVVVFDEQPGAFCVEPQTAPPNSLNHAPHTVYPGEPLVATTSWSWKQDG